MVNKENKMNLKQFMDELEKRRRTLEGDVNNLLNNFSDQTGLCVDSIAVNKLTCDSGQVASYIYSVDISLQLKL